MTFSTFNRFFQSRPINHLIFWTLFVLVGSFIFSYQQNFPYLFYLLNFVVQLPVLLLYTYLVVYALVPFLLLKGRYLTLSLIHISEPTRRTPISYAVFC